MLLGARDFLFNRIQQPIVELPYDAEVEYLGSTGTQWIDTGILPTFNTKVEATFQFTAIGTPVFGTCENENLNAFLLTTVQDSSSKKCFSAQFGNSTTNQLSYIVQNTQNAIDIEFSKDGLFINNNKVVEFVDPQEFTPYGTIYMFGRNVPSSITYSVLGSVKISRFKILENNIVIRDYIPVRCGTTGYMYDMITKTFAQNNGEFVVGKDICLTEYTTAGDVYNDAIFKTNVIMTDDHAVEVDFMHSSLDSTFRSPVGIRTSDGSTDSFIINSSSSTKSSWAYSSEKYETFPTNVVNHKYHAILKKGYAAIDEYSTTSMNSSIVPSLYTLAIFGRNNKGTLSNQFRGNIYEIKIYKNNILKWHFVPISVLDEIPFGAMLDVIHNHTYFDTNKHLISGPLIGQKIRELYKTS